MEYEVQIIFYDSGIRRMTSFRKNVSTLDELKTAFLKRFGNINNAPNKALKEKGLVKQITYVSTSLSEWVTLVNTKTRWELNIRKI